jgi:hypothetical protein
MRQLKQRIALRFRLRALSEAQTRGYIWNRLKLAGARNPIFSLPAIRRVFVHSRGLPRLINTICDNALISTFADGLQRVNDSIIDEVAVDLQLSQVETGRKGASSPYPASRSREGSAGWSELSENRKEDNYN